MATFMEQMFRDLQNYLERGDMESAGVLMGQIFNEIEPPVKDDQGELIDSYDAGEMFTNAFMSEM